MAPCFNFVSIPSSFVGESVDLNCSGYLTQRLRSASMEIGKDWLISANVVLQRW